MRGIATHWGYWGFTAETCSCVGRVASDLVMNCLEVKALLWPSLLELFVHAIIFEALRWGVSRGLRLKVTEATPVTAMCRRKGICVFRQSVLYIRALISCGHIFVHLKYDYHTFLSFLLQATWSCAVWHRFMTSHKAKIPKLRTSLQSF